MPRKPSTVRTMPADCSSWVAAMPVGAAPRTSTPCRAQASRATPSAVVLPVPARPTATLTPAPSPVIARTIACWSAPSTGLASAKVVRTISGATIATLSRLLASRPDTVAFARLKVAVRSAACRPGGSGHPRVTDNIRAALPAPVSASCPTSDSTRTLGGQRCLVPMRVRVRTNAGTVFSTTAAVRTTGPWWRLSQLSAMALVRGGSARQLAFVRPGRVLDDGPLWGPAFSLASGLLANSISGPALAEPLEQLSILRLPLAVPFLFFDRRPRRPPGPATLRPRSRVGAIASVQVTAVQVAQAPSPLGSVAMMTGCTSGAPRTLPMPVHSRRTPDHDPGPPGAPRRSRHPPRVEQAAPTHCRGCPTVRWCARRRDPQHRLALDRPQDHRTRPAVLSWALRAARRDRSLPSTWP